MGLIVCLSYIIEYNMLGNEFLNEVFTERTYDKNNSYTLVIVVRRPR